MAFSDGDPFVSGSLYSFQQGNRMMQNYRGATVPSNLQAGALFSDSDDDKLHHQGTSELLEVFTEKTILTWENLLSNSGFGVWSQSDTYKGIATMAYDTGAKGAGSAPSVGDAAVGGTSGAIAKVISYTIASGTWAGGDAAGIFTLGVCNGRFHDNETVTFDGVETCLINQPNSAAGVDLLQNGEFSIDTDPPPGWTAVTATLTTEAGGQVGNCMQVASSGAALGKAYQDITTVIGKIYKLSLYFKKGTSATGKFMIGITTDEDSIYDSGALSDAAWTAKTATFEATATTTRITMQTTDATITENSLFDEITAYEITPCCTDGDAKAMDGWIKDTTADIYREHSGANVKDGSFYANKLIVTTAADFVRFPGTFYDNEEWYMQFQGRTVTFGKWVKTSTASHAKLTITDSAGSTSSSFHTGGGTYEWLEVTRAIDAGATSVAFYVYGDVVGNVDGTTIIYHCQGMLVFGSHIGEGNYQPKQQEWIWTEAYISSNLPADGYSTTSWATLNLEADSDGKLPKGLKAYYVFVEANDSGSAGAACYIAFRPGAGLGIEVVSPAGLTNDVGAVFSQMMNCGASGDIDWLISATGAGTFDLKKVRFMAVQVN